MLRRKKLSKLILVDGNSIMNRAFYGIMGSKMLTAKDGRYTNAVYGFLSIIFKVMDDIKPDYMAVAFDLKAPTERHKMYEGYKATRKGMPNELAEQMPIIKEILKAMNIAIIEKEGYEGDDILGTLARRGEKENFDVTILSGDRDNFQIATDKITIRIPRTKMGKTETDEYNRSKIIEEYGIEPIQLIEVKGLQGDTSDNIPGVPGVGEKTALNLIKQYGTIENLYEQLEQGNAEVKGKLKENLQNNKDLAILSKNLGTINVNVPIEETTDYLKVEQWDNEAVLSIFKELNFNRFIDRFNLQNNNVNAINQPKDLYTIIDVENDSKIDVIKEQILNTKKMFFYFDKQKDDNSTQIIKKKIKSISIYNPDKNEVNYINFNNVKIENFKDIFENNEIQKYGYKLDEDYVLLKQLGIKPNNFAYDAQIAAYDLDPTSKYTMNDLAMKYLNIDIDEFVKIDDAKQLGEQINIFDSINVEKEKDGKREENAIYVYCIAKLYEETTKKLEEIGSLELFNNIEMPLVEVLGEMQFNGMYVDKQELIEIGENLKQQLLILTKQIYELAGEEFNMNSTQQLGNILFEKLGLPAGKKNKKGYSTDVDILEKIKNEHDIVPKILEYRSLMKLNSTYVEGLLPFINLNTNRIHSHFHQTITATGRISSTEPNLQNIPTRIELGKTLRKVFKPEPGYVYIDADYSQIELRVLAHISKDENMVQAFKNDEDIHKQAASKVLGIPMDEVTKEQRSSAKAVNFGIVYGISEFGLAEQLGISKKQAKEYIEQYLEKYSGIKKFMNDVVEQAKEQGYVETLFHRRRYIPELKSNNYMVRQFGARAAMNTPIQGTAADIMKIAMIDVYKQLKQYNLDAKIVLQVHDELIIECNKIHKERATEILRTCMESAIKLDVPIKAETSEAETWYDAK